jgi:hypothetical protein
MNKLGFAWMLVVAGCGNAGVTQQSAAAACITAGACGIIFQNGVSGCTQYIASVNNPEVAARAHISPGQVNCIAAAGNNCAAAKRCLANGQTPAPCSGGVGVTTCTGNVWGQCNVGAGTGGNQGVQLFDCVQYGQMCVANNGNVDCGYGTCGGGAASCVTPDGNPGGNVVQSCDNGILHRADCSKVASSCNPSGVAHCRGNGPAGAAPSFANDTLRCEGSVLVSCLDGQEGRYDCGQLNLGCYTNPSGTGFGCFAGTECNPSNFSASCSGTRLTFCNKGKIATADCAAAGFAGCNPNNGGACTP